MRIAISRIEHSTLMPGVERMRAHFRGHSFTPHSHDTYAVGVTSVGVQAFNYRGRAHHSLPDQAFVLHPDERHDGHAGDEGGFGYRIAYIDPALIRDAAETKSLPFVREPVVGEGLLRRAIGDLVAQDDDPVDGLMATCNLVALADALVGAARDMPAPAGPVARKAVGRVRDMLLARWDERLSIVELEAVAGLSRWQLARHFRRAYGVSPHRFHVLRRLDRARELLSQGEALAEVAQRCGFADQAHLSRQFRGAYGLSPGRWRALIARHA